MTDFITAAVRLVLLTLWSFSCVGLQTICLRLRLPARMFIPFRWHRGVVRLLGMKITVHGQRSKAKPTLYVSNHASYLDIVILGSQLKGHFVSKAEVRQWPLFGYLSTMQQTVFIERNPRLAMEHQANLAELMAEKRNLILFPEGTSGAGNRVLPFKSTLFSVATMLQQQDIPVTVQPVTIAYTRLDGMPLRRVLRPLVAWYGDMAMGSHLWQLLRLGRLGVDVTLHDPVPIAQFVHRKDLSAYCQRQVAAGLKASYTGTYHVSTSGT
jgi:lyso-ornithine lipid O-acyltransferase